MSSDLIKRPERTLALLFIIVSSLFGIYGTTIGSLLLAQLSGASFLQASFQFLAHPYAQIFGFLFGFVYGVELLLVPRFKATRIPSYQISFLCFILLTAANILFIAASFISIFLLKIGSILLLISTLLYSSQISRIAFLPSGGFHETDPLIFESSISAILVAIIIALSSFFPSIQAFSDDLIRLSLLGFVGSMIYTVEIRSVSFRQTDYRPGAAKVAYVAQAFAIAAGFVSALHFSIILSVISQLLYLFASLMSLASLKLVEFSHSLMYRPSMTPIHYRIMKYNDASMLAASAWLLIGLASGMIASFVNSISFVARDIMIHSIAIGFIGATIICFAPMLLPGLLGRRGPTTGLSFIPLILLNVGMALRFFGDIFASPEFPSWETLSGPLILASIFWFLYMIHNVGKKKIYLQMRPEVSLDEKSMQHVAELQVLLEGGRIRFWFVFLDGSFFILPAKKKRFLTSRWLDAEQLITRFHEGIFNISIDGLNLECSSSIIKEKKMIRKIEKKFKDKYGERNFRDLIGEDSEYAIQLLPQP